MSNPDLVRPEDRGQRPASLPEVLDEVTTALADLTAVLDDDGQFGVLVHQVCEQVVRVVPGVAHATVTLLHDDRPNTAASTSDVVTELDQDQYRAGDGPCMQAARTGQLVRVAIEQAHQRWPKLAADAAAAGIGSFLSAPVVLSEAHAGTINCYGTSDTGFADLDAKLLDLFTTAVAGTVHGYYRYSRVSELAQQLGAALESRAVIDQAKGIIMAVQRIPADEAFARLVEQSQREHIKVRDLAQRFVEHVLTGSE